MKIFGEFINRIKNYNQKVNWMVFCFIFSFTTGMKKFKSNLNIDLIISNVLLKKILKRCMA